MFLLSDLLFELTHKFPTRQNMPCHGFHDLLLRGSRRQVQLCVEGIESKDVVVGPSRRTWRHIANLVVVIVTLEGAVGQLFLLRGTFRQLTFVRRDVVEHPMRNLEPEWGILVEHDQCETLRAFGRRLPQQFRRYVVLAFAVAVLVGDRFINKTAASQFQGGS